MQTVLVRKPDDDFLKRFLDEQANLDFSYSEVGATNSLVPDGYAVDESRIVLGRGQAVFESAKIALCGWKQFQLGWVDIWSAETPLEKGREVAILGWAYGFWWLNACRIVYVVDEDGPVRKFGFAYGTLPGHVESGEERFLLEWERETGQVSFDILAFSKPRHIATRLGYPLVRRKQKRFGREAATAIYREVHPEMQLPLVVQNEI